jgi:hypothetical protein
MKVYKIIISILCFANISEAEWRIVKIGRCEWCYQLIVGKGRNDDTNRVYVSSGDGAIYEWTYRNGSWNYINIGSGTKRMIALCMGEGRNDDTLRIYGANADGYVYEFTYSEGWWRKEQLPDPEGLNTAVTVGDGRDDGVNRVYASGWGTEVKEYTWDGTSWSRVDVTPYYINIWPFDIGDGRNDGINRLYCPGWSTDYVHEYTWKDSLYSETPISINETSCKTVIGDGRNDGVNRIYVSTRGSGIYELTYDSGNWEIVELPKTSPSGQTAWGLVLGRTRSDGKIRVYSNPRFGGGIHETSWDGSRWVDSIVDATTGASTDITIGAGRNDDTVRIYIGATDGSVYEITHSDPWVEVEENNTFTPNNYKLEPNYPNPFSKETLIKYTIKRKIKASIKVYNILGKLLNTLVDKIHDPGYYTIQWNGKDNFGNKVPNGIYFYRLKAGNYIITKKMCLVR